VAPVNANLAEAGGAAEREARDVLGEDPRDQLPEAARFGRPEQRFENDLAGPDAARFAIDVDRVFADAGVARPRAVETGRGPGDDPTVTLGDDRGIALAALLDRRGDVRRRARRSLERGDALFDPLVVDLGDGGGVVERGEPGSERSGGHGNLPRRGDSPGASFHATARLMIRQADRADGLDRKT